MAAGFLIISPGLRETVLKGFAEAADGLDKYSPYSYVGLALALLCCLVAVFSRASAPR
jgi:hypothetical protein